VGRQKTASFALAIEEEKKRGTHDVMGQMRRLGKRRDVLVRLIPANRRYRSYIKGEGWRKNTPHTQQKKKKKHPPPPTKKRGKRGHLGRSHLKKRKWSVPPRPARKKGDCCAIVGKKEIVFLKRIEGREKKEGNELFHNAKEFRGGLEGERGNEIRSILFERKGGKWFWGGEKRLGEFRQTLLNRNGKKKKKRSEFPSGAVERGMETN